MNVNLYLRHDDLASLRIVGRYADGRAQIRNETAALFIGLDADEAEALSDVFAGLSDRIRAQAVET